MKNSKSLLIAGDTIIDITDHVQQVGGYTDGELKCRGVGLEVFRSMHINGNAVIFINYSGQQRIFGEWVDIYSLNTMWDYSTYAEYDMKPMGDKLPLITGALKVLRDKFIIN